MKQPPLDIYEIVQVDNHTFGITWSDGTKSKYRLSELQRKCPCAQCNVDGVGVKVDADVRAVQIKSIGRYAMKIQYTTGCSNGIYTYGLLRDIAEGKSV